MTERYSEEFKQEILRRLTAGETPRALAEETGAKRRTLERWRTIAKKQHTGTLPPETDPHTNEPEIESKIDTEELHRLREENSGLKKEISDLTEKCKLIEEEWNFTKGEIEFLSKMSLAWQERYQSLLIKYNEDRAH